MALEVANKIKRYYYLHLFGETDLKPLYEHYVLGRPKEEIFTEDQLSYVMFDLVEDKVDLSTVLGYELKENSFALHEEIKSGICYNVSLLDAAYIEEQTHQISPFELETPYLYRLVKNINKLP